MRNAGAIFVGAVVAGVAGRLLRRLQPRAAHRRLRPVLQRPVACSRSCAASTSSSTTSRRSPRSPGTSTPSPAPRTCPRTRPPSGSGSADDLARRAPAAAGAAGPHALRRPAAAGRATGSTPTRTRTRCPPSCSPTWARRSGTRRWSSTATPTGTPSALRTDLAAYLTRSGGRADRAGAGVGGQRLQRGAAADPAGVRRRRADGAGLHAVLLDAPDHLRGHRHRLGRRAPPRRLHHRRGRGRRAGARAARRTSSS